MLGWLFWRSTLIWDNSFDVIKATQHGHATLWHLCSFWSCRSWTFPLKKLAFCFWAGRPISSAISTFFFFLNKRPSSSNILAERFEHINFILIVSYHWEFSVPCSHKLSSKSFSVFILFSFLLLSFEWPVDDCFSLFQSFFFSWIMHPHDSTFANSTICCFETSFWLFNCQVSYFIPLMST